MKLPQTFAETAAMIPGLDAQRFLAAMEAPPTVGIRINPSKIKDAAEAGYPEASPVEWNREGYYLDERPLFTLNPLLHAGAFYVQDPSSMIYGELTTKALELLPEERRRAPKVLDMCASPGGKTTAMTARLPEGGVIVANEYVDKRAGALRENLAKWGHAATIVCNSDSAAFASAGEIFDIVAVDAPCSGEGMMRKDEDARNQWSESLVRQCASLQREILANACEALRPGGIMIYSTCTFNTSENEVNLAYLVEEMGLIPVDTGLAGTGGIMGQLQGDYPALRFMPHSTRGEGLFAAMLMKPDDDSDTLSESRALSREKRDKKGKRGKERKGGRNDDIKGTAHLTRWLDPAKEWALLEKGDCVVALPAEAARTAEILESHVRIIGRGVTIAERRGKDYAPTAELALCRQREREAFPAVEVDKETALSYLRGEALSLPKAPKGYLVITFGGVAIGMVKNLGTRANNLWPSRWKIRHV